MTVPTEVRRELAARVDRLGADECREVVRLVVDVFADSPRFRDPAELAQWVADSLAAISDELARHDLLTQD